MNRIRLFVEGKADKKFIKDYLFFLKSILLTDNDFVLIGSNNEKAIQDRIEDFTRNSDKEGINLLIFDADNDYLQTKSKLSRIKSKLKIEFELFLLPNNKEDGTLEHLLSSIINPDNQLIFDCFEEYQNCLKQEPRFKIPALKTKMYAYVDTLLSKKEEDFAKEDKRDYLNTDHWNLSHNFLNPLKSFLESYL